jgi:hypothetical protein
VVLPPCPPLSPPGEQPSPSLGEMSVPAHTLNLCKTDGVLECFGFCECCRP